MTTFRWLHLTDFHLGMKQHKTLCPNMETEFFNDLASMLEDQPKLDLVLFTGDLVDKGTADEFSDLEGWLQTLWARLGEIGHQPHLLVVPGNHDLNRPQKGNPDAKVLQMAWDKETQEVFWENPIQAIEHLST